MNRTAFQPGDAVLLVAHGTVTNLDDMPAFLARIRRGRPASEQLVAELRHRYQAIGGSPLLDITASQARALEAELGIPVLVGMRLWDPSIEQALKDAAARGLKRLCVLPLAPFSVHVYAEAARASLQRVQAESNVQIELVDVAPWGSDPEFVAAYARKIGLLLEQSPDAELLLTAHSLPQIAIRNGDPYASQVEACARAIAKELGRDYRLVYQSQGADGGDWLGPDVRTSLLELVAQGKRDVVLAPIGFLSEHVETLYDLDLEAARWAEELGLRLQRCSTVNDDPRFIAALAGIVKRSMS